METICYYRCSTSDQSIEAQRNALNVVADQEYSDVGVSGAIPAMKRPQFAALFGYIRKGDALHVYAVDRLGRDALDIQSTIRALLKKGVTVHVHGVGIIGNGVGEIIVAVLAQLADMERQRIIERCESGRDAARKSLAATGLTHRGKVSLGRRVKADAAQVIAWRNQGNSISATAKQFNLSPSTVKRYCAGEV